MKEVNDFWQGAVVGTASQAVKQLKNRGKQKKPIKIGVFARYDPNVIDFFKATGEGWKTRMNDVLAEYIA